MTDAEWTKLYIVVGFFVVVNFSAIFAFIFGAFKISVRMTVFFTKLDAKADKAQETAVRAHKRIDVIEQTN